MARKVYTADIGTEFILDTDNDISDSSAQKIRAVRPDGTTVDWLDASVTDTTCVKHVKTTDTLNVEGRWILQAWVQWADGTTLHGDEYQVTIYALKGA